VYGENQEKRDCFEHFIRNKTFQAQMNWAREMDGPPFHFILHDSGLMVVHLNDETSNLDDDNYGLFFL
jgi:hypothetical protein